MAELVRYAATLRYPTRWTVLDAPSRDQTKALVTWLQGKAEYLDGLQAPDGTRIGDEVERSVEATLDGMLARDFIRGRQPPERTNAYWHRMLISARDRIWASPRPPVVSVEFGSLDVPGSVGLADWLRGVALAAQTGLDHVITREEIALSGDPTATRAVALAWLTDHASHALSDLLRLSAELDGTTGGGHLPDWFERLAARASSEMASLSGGAHEATPEATRLHREAAGLAVRLLKLVFDDLGTEKRREPGVRWSLGQQVGERG